MRTGFWRRRGEMDCHTRRSIRPSCQIEDAHCGELVCVRRCRDGVRARAWRLGDSGAWCGRACDGGRFFLAGRAAPRALPFVSVYVRVALERRGCVDTL